MLSQNIFNRFRGLGQYGCPYDAILKLAKEEILIAAKALLKDGPNSIEYKKRSPHVDDYITAYNSGVKTKLI